VSFRAVDKKVYYGVKKEIQGNRYRVKYEGYNFESWLAANQFTVTSTTTTPVYSSGSSTNGGNNVPTATTADLRSILDFGKSRGWASAIQERKLSEFVARFTDQDKRNLVQFISQAKTMSARFFVLKSLLAGDNYETLQKFINQLNAYPEAFQQERCLVINTKSIIQQWQFSCSVTTVQTFLADICPRYAWEIKQIASYDAIANNPNHPMAQQQKELLEKYGGKASARGDVSGVAIGINGPLNELVGPLLGVTFYAQEVNEPLPAIFSKVRSQLDRGINVPLLVGFMGTDTRHFILALNYRRVGGVHEYFIYDPWEGKSGYVSEDNILRNSFYPLLSQWKLSLDYYYPVYN
jgi:hypothetical protein